MFINDLDERLSLVGVKSLLNADDLVILANDPPAFRRGLAAVASWSVENKMQVTQERRRS